MADANQNPNPQGGGQPPLQVKVPDEVQKGVYSNAVSVNVNSNEVVLDFGYLLPNTPAPVIEVVSRINMNQRTAESFLSVLGGALDDFKKKQAQQSTPAPMGPAPMPEQAMPQQPMGPAPMPGQPMGPAPMGPQPYPINA